MKDSDVGQALDDIIWWQEKNVPPLMEAVNDRWWPRSNVWETDPARIKALLEADDCDFLSLTGLPDDHWPLFMIWASSHIQNFRDWDQFILSAVRAGRLRCSGQYVQDLTWEYRTTHIHGTWSGHDITTEWHRSDDLDRILQASARAMVTASEQQIGQQATQPGELSAGGAVVSRGGVHRSPGLFERKPQATGRRRFRAGTTEPTLYTLAHQYERTGYSVDDVFYVFTPEASQEDVPSGYVVVGGANYNTYPEIYATRNIVLLHNADGYGGTLDVTLQPNTEEVLLAKAEDLEEVR